MFSLLCFPLLTTFLFLMGSWLSGSELEVFTTYRTELLRLWWASLGVLLVLGRGGGELFVWGTYLLWTKYERKVKIYILVGNLLGWNILLISLYRYWLRTVSSTFCRRLKLAFLRCRNTPTDNNKVLLLSQLIVFSYYYADKKLLHFMISYSFTGPVFHTISLPAL
jgi:hypothetical protein